MVPCHGHGVTGYRISVRHRPARGDVHDTRARPTRMVKFTLPLLAAVSGLTDGATATSGLFIGPPWRCGPVALQPHNVRPTGGCDWGRGLRSARHHRLHRYTSIALQKFSLLCLSTKLMTVACICSGGVRGWRKKAYYLMSLKWAVHLSGTGERHLTGAAGRARVDARGEEQAASGRGIPGAPEATDRSRLKAPGSGAPASTHHSALHSNAPPLRVHFHLI